MYVTNETVGTANGLGLFNSTLQYHTIPLHSFSISLIVYKIHYHTFARAIKYLRCRSQIIYVSNQGINL